MSDDLNNKIQQIADILGKESMPDNVKGLLSLLAGSLGSKEEAPGKPAEAETVAEAEPEAPVEQVVKKRPEAEDNSELFRKVKKVLEKVPAANDPRVTLLNAIKPFMNSRRQKKLSNCIQLLQMTTLARMLNDQEK